MYLLTTSLASSEPLTYLNSQGAEKLRAHAWLILGILVDFSHLHRGVGDIASGGRPRSDAAPHGRLHPH